MKSNSFYLSRNFSFFWRVGMFCGEVWSLNWGGELISSDNWFDDVFVSKKFTD